MPLAAHVRVRDIEAFVHLVESGAVPGKAVLVERLLQRHTVEHLTVPAIRCCVPEHAFDFMHLSFVVAGTAPQESAANIAVQVEGFVPAVSLGNAEDEDGFARNLGKERDAS